MGPPDCHCLQVLPQSTLEFVSNRIEGKCLLRAFKSLESHRGGEVGMRKQEKDRNGSVLGLQSPWNGWEMDASL